MVCISCITMHCIFRNELCKCIVTSVSLKVINQAVQHTSPGQTSVVRADQPLYALAKYIQLLWRDTSGETKFVKLQGGLHLEMTSFCVLGSWLDGSGWCRAIKGSEVTSSGMVVPPFDEWCAEESQAYL